MFLSTRSCLNASTSAFVLSLSVNPPRKIDGDDKTVGFGSETLSERGACLLIVGGVFNRLFPETARVVAA